MDPARIFTESLTPCPELENRAEFLHSQGHSRRCGPRASAAACPLLPESDGQPPKCVPSLRANTGNSRSSCGAVWCNIRFATLMEPFGLADR